MTALKGAETGNLQNVPGATWYRLASSDNIGIEGSTGAVSPAESVQCTQEIQQSTAASSKATPAPPEAAPPPAEATRPKNKGKEGEGAAEDWRQW